MVKDRGVRIFLVSRWQDKIISAQNMLHYLTQDAHERDHPVVLCNVHAPFLLCSQKNDLALTLNYQFLVKKYIETNFLFL